MKLLKYEGFLLEKLILESNIIYSGKFKKVLEKLPDNRIAQSLLEIEDEDLEVTANFFDVKIDSDDVVTFTNDRAAQRILTPELEQVRWTGNRGAWLTHSEGNINIFLRMGYAPEIGTPVYQPNRTEIGEIISTWMSPRTNKNWCYVKFPGGEGVYNKERLVTVAGDELKKKVFATGRQEIRVGRAVRSLLNAKGVTYTDAEIEVFVNLFRGVLSVMNDVFSHFEIVEGEELLYWYKRENYEFPHRGSLGSSCQAVGRRDWLEIYIDNPDTIKLLILKSFDNPDKILGRALLWYLDDGGILMDFIYISKDSDKNVFKEYARNKGYIIREDVNGNWVASTKIKPEGYGAYPSVDTMRSWNRNTGKISNRRFEGSREIVWSQGDEDEEFEDEFG
jgi:hypothetical protein